MRYSVSWPSKRDKLDMLEWPSSTPEVQKMCNYLTIKLPEKHPQIEEKKQLKSCMKAIVTHLIVEQDERLLGLERPFFTMFSRFWRHRSGLTFQCLLFRAYWSLMLSNHLIICLNVGLLNGSSLQHSSINSFNPCAYSFGGALKGGRSLATYALGTSISGFVENGRQPSIISCKIKANEKTSTLVSYSSFL